MSLFHDEDHSRPCDLFWTQRDIGVVTEPCRVRFDIRPCCENLLCRGATESVLSADEESAMVHGLILERVLRDIEALESLNQFPLFENELAGFNHDFIARLAIDLGLREVDG